MQEMNPLPASVPQDIVGTWIREWFDQEGRLFPLPGERDQNFCLERTDGRRFVAKLTPPGEDPAWLEAEQAALEWAGEHAPNLALPRVQRTREGRTLAWIGTASRALRLLDWVEGRTWATTRPHDRVLLESLGTALGSLGLALRDFQHPVVHRTFKWDLTQAAWIAPHLGIHPEGPHRAWVQAALADFQDRVEPALRSLPHQVIYNDANDHNILVREGRVAGFVDFGDLVYAPRICDLAIACAYALMGQGRREDWALSDPPVGVHEGGHREAQMSKRSSLVDHSPLDAACVITSAYHARFPLEASELEVLWSLIRLRLAVSVTNSALARHAKPDDPYQTISEAPAWDLLERLARIHPRRATCALRAACGFPAHPQTPALEAWLGAHTATFAAIMAVDPRREPSAILDLSVSSLDLGGGDRWEMEALDALGAQRCQEEGAHLAIGRYQEPRLLYPFGTFQDQGLEREEPRTVHLGCDLFLPAGSPVFAPLPGRVVGLKDNAIQGDYGPTVILEHQAAGDGPTFFTLYGHLDPECLDNLEPGQRVEAGQRIARVGARPVNGDWTPHVHFQIMLDLLDLDGDFPGVARPSDARLFAGLCPDPNLILGCPRPIDARAHTVEGLLARRRETLAPSLSISYDRPLHIVRGAMQYLYDAEGRRYLDMVNNVPHVGHANPRVVAAAARQLALLNTNTRYLHPLIEAFGERLKATLPPELSVCFFVNSGSEANELALRLARTVTGRKGTVVVDVAYHGNTGALIEISPYKNEGPGGAGAPPWVQKIALPDAYRGRFRGEATGPRYGALVDEAMDALEARGFPPSAFIAESMLGCGGQVVLPEGYFAEAFRRVRARGGLCIADEVQVGFGRAGTHFWAFQTQGVVPDIVTLGKPIGNGWPLGAVITTPAVAQAFANGMEYFNTFGGNPASMAVGLAVLDELQGRGLQARALHLGNRIQDGLRALQARFPVIGEVRGLGLYLGAEMVKDPTTREPHPAAASHVANRLKDLGVLISTDGPDHNVLKIKPPLVITEADADHLLACLERALEEDGAR